MRAIRAAGLALALATAAACGGDDGEADQPGSPAVYERIEATTDCVELQDTFDQASANHERATNADEREWTTAYMRAADERMTEVGCYDD